MIAKKLLGSIEYDGELGEIINPYTTKVDCGGDFF